MRNFASKKKIASLLIIAILLTSCSGLAKRQNIVDNIIPDYKRRMYTVADYIPYTYDEMRSAQAYYGRELTDFFYSNTATPAVLLRDTKEKQDDFNIELMYRTHNYKTIKKRFAMYVEDESSTQEEKEKARQKEYDDYYKLQNAEGINTIKKYNAGDAEGMPLMSIKVIMSTATMSSLDSIYSEAECEIYKPVYIDNEVYKSLKFGDTLKFIVPATNSTVDAKDTKEVECTYVATDSLMYKNDSGDEAYYYIAGVDGTNDIRRILDYNGKTLETYEETKILQFMKNTRVTRSSDPQHLMIDVIEDNLTEYNFDDLAIRALGGGYLIIDYKDYIYANSITTNLKGYITSLTEYYNQRIE